MLALWGQVLRFIWTPLLPSGGLYKIELLLSASDPLLSSLTQTYPKSPKSPGQDTEHSSSCREPRSCCWFSWREQSTSREWWIPYSLGMEPFTTRTITCYLLKPLNKLSWGMSYSKQFLFPLEAAHPSSLFPCFPVSLILSRCPKNTFWQISWHVAATLLPDHDRSLLPWHKSSKKKVNSTFLWHSRGLCCVLAALLI